MNRTATCPNANVQRQIDDAYSAKGLSFEPYRKRSKMMPRGDDSVAATQRLRGGGEGKREMSEKDEKKRNPGRGCVSKWPRYSNLS